jgi:tetratricopeptide (TPR) repeat protein
MVTGLKIMKRSNFYLILWLVCLLAVWIGSAEAEQEPSLVLHFEPGKARLSAAQKADLRQFFRTYALDSQGRVFVVGYTDAKGGESENYGLSRNRADAVRREIVRVLGVDSDIVMSVGKGAESPVATNRTVQGRALNRRVEVHLANGKVREPPRVYGPGDPYLPQIQDLLGKADAAIKARRLADALQELKQARALGADHYARWHTLSGIAGYYAGTDLADARAHLAAAVKLEPLDADAREYLSRVEARQKVAGGEVTKDTGHTPETAIGVSEMAQQYEFLRLFEVDPLTHRRLEPHPVEMWQCVDRQGAPVVYFFDISRAFQWAFAQTAVAAPSSGRQVSSSPVQAIPGTAATNGPAVADSGKSQAPAGKNSGRIWESKIFK